MRYTLIHQLLLTERLLYETIVFAFDNLDSEDPLLKLMVDVHCNDYAGQNNEQEPELRDYLPHNFLLRVMDRQHELSYRDENMRNALYACDYHGHRSQAERDSCSNKVEYEA